MAGTKPKQYAKRGGGKVGRKPLSKPSAVNGAGVRVTKKRLPPAPNYNGRYLIAMDFGTTYSSVAYGFVPTESLNPSPDSPTSTVNDIEPEVLQTYPDMNSPDQGYAHKQVPTVSMYPPTGSGRCDWGYSVKRMMDQGVPQGISVFHHFKLMLSDSLETRDLREQIRTRLLESGKSIVEVISDYIGELYAHTARKIEQTAGSHFRNLAKEVIFVISVPALWKSNALRLMQSAAHRAELPEPQLVSEPEAAALYVLRESARLKSKQFGVGDVFMVVDAGGGTVDVVTYRIARISPFRLEEVASGMGGTCGSNRINEELRKWLRARLKETKQYSKSDIKDFIHASDAVFEAEKRNFTGADRDLRCRIHGLNSNGGIPFEKNIVRVTQDTMCGIFDPIIENEVIALIQRQLDAAHSKAQQAHRIHLVKYIVLVGGFSASEYLIKKVEERFKTLQGRELCYPIEVLHPMQDSETVVARGAFLRYLNKSFIDTYFIRTSFGILQDEKYYRSDHGNLPKEWDEHAREYLVRDCIRWLVEYGDKMSYNEQLEPFENFHWILDANFDFEEDDSKKECYCELFLSDDPNPQDHLTKERMRTLNKHLEPYVRLECDLSDIDPSMLKKENKRGKAYYMIPYRLEFSKVGMMSTWKLRVPELPGAKVTSIQKNIRAAFGPGDVF